MAGLDDIRGTVGARLFCEEDFTFEKTKEELAQAVRADIAPRVSKILESELGKVSIDKDGDIVLHIKDVAYIYLTSTGATCSAVNVQLSDVPISPTVHALPKVMAELRDLRPYLKPIDYGVRIFCSFWYPTPESVHELHSRYFSSLPQFSEREHAELDTLSCSYAYTSGLFQDTINLDTKSEQVSVRIIRDANAIGFPDFSEFWDRANIGYVVSMVAPFLEPVRRTGLTGLMSSITPSKK